MKVCIIYNMKEGPYGGVNQFLKVIVSYFRKEEMYTDIPEEADIFIFNSCNDIERVIDLKKHFQNKVFVQRIDGPIRLYNSFKDKRDLVTNTMNDVVADATIYQSLYSKNANYELGLKTNGLESIIMNVANEQFFNLIGKTPFSNNRKIRLVASSWSANQKKGFDVYEFLDKTLDFTKFEMVFIGNTPIKFKNIKHILPQKSRELSDILKEQDIYIAASQKDPCSNALIEALSCGLPAVVRKDGGHPEIVKKGGECFENKEEILPLIDKIVNNYADYQRNIIAPNFDKIGKQYKDFLGYVLNQFRTGERKIKRINFLKKIKIKIICLNWKLTEKFEHFWG